MGQHSEGFHAQEAGGEGDVQEGELSHEVGPIFLDWACQDKAKLVPLEGRGLRLRIKKVPWNSFEPERVMEFRTPPLPRPLSAS